MYNKLYNIGMKYTILDTEEFTDWFNQQTSKQQVQIEKRLFNIETEGHFGESKYLEEGLWELKWENGRRLYYAYIQEEQILLLLGGNKNGQNKDINYAKKILRTYTQS